MKVKVINEFRDKTADLKLRKVNEVFEVNSKRAAYLASMKVVEVVEEKKEVKKGTE